MQNSESTFKTHGTIYPLIHPYKTDVLDVGDGHQLYIEECGNPNGIPVVVLHGGPGGGCSPRMRQFFNPDAFRVILFDQRGCGRSKPLASVENNTTWHLIDDIELIRKKLKINRWMVFGGSWGSTLALLYAQSHPDRVQHLILRGIFLLTQAELDWFYAGGAARFFPHEWEDFIQLLPEHEKNDVIVGFHKYLFGNDKEKQYEFAERWTKWETSLATLSLDPSVLHPSKEFARTFARIENHYFFNKGFLEFDGKILHDIKKISHIPGSIVQGRYDMICPPSSAIELHQKWDNSRLIMVANAGHSLSETGITTALIAIMDKLCT